MKRWYLAFVLVLLSSAAFATVLPPTPGVVTGIILKPNEQPSINATLGFTLSQAGSLVGPSTAVTAETVPCGTDESGSVVGITKPLVPPVLSANYGAGSIPGGAVYYVYYTYFNATGETTPGPVGQILLTANGTIQGAAPLLHPSTATGYNVYIGTTPLNTAGTVAVTGFTSWSWGTTPFSGFGVPPVSNSTTCSLVFNDAIIPANTTYSVNLVDSSGKQVAGFPQRYYLAGSVVDIAQLTPAANIYAKFPTAIIAQPKGNALQSILGPLTLNQYDLQLNDIQVTGGPCTLGGIMYVGVCTKWGPGDIGAQINAAYAALPPGGGEIDIQPNPLGTCYDYSTTINFSTVGKLPFVRSLGGACLNFLPTTGNGIFVDYVAIGVLPASFHGFQSLYLINNGCAASQGCGGTAVGIQVGMTNQGDLDASMISDTIQGFAVGYSNNNPLAVQIQWYAPTITSGITGFLLGPLTGFELNGGTVAGNVTAIKLTSTGNIELSIFGTQFFSNIGSTAGIIDATAVVGSPAAVDCHDCHFEIQPSGGEHMVAGNIDVHMFGGLIVDDNLTAGTGDWFFSLSGNAFDLFGTEVLCGRTSMTQAFLLNSGVRAGFLVPYIGDTRCAAVVGGANATRATVWPYGGSAINPQPAIIEAPFAHTENGNAQTPVLLQDICYGNSSTHSYQCSYNGGPFMTVAQIVTATLTTTAAATDNVAVVGMSATGHCSLEPTNTGAAGGIASVFISNKTTNQITVTHTNTAGWTFDVICTPQ